MSNVEYEFGGYATRNDLLCGDGRTIRKNAFKDNDGQTVPLIWNHDHSNPDAVLGHALLENRDDGVYAYCTLNDTESGQRVRKLVHNGDVRSLSIYANKLKQIGGDVIHGSIRELSLVLAGANPGAYIDFVMAHGDEEDEGVYANYDENSITIYHSDTPANAKEEKKEDTKMSEETKKTDGEKTVADVFNELTEEQKTVVYAMIGQAIEDAGADDEDDEGGNEMNHNIFENDSMEMNVLTHSDQATIIENAKRSSVGSFREALSNYVQDNQLAHGLDLSDTEVLNELLPDYKNLNPGAPDILGPDQSWVMHVINKIHKSPYSRIRTRQADARAAELREKLKAKGYQNKGDQKKLTEHIKLLGRSFDPQTVYIKDELHRDDIIDITDFSIVDYVWNLMKGNLYETLALAALVGDGREDTDPDKIKEEHIHSIYNDDELYTIHAEIDVEAMKAELQGTNTGANFGESFVYAEAVIQKSLYARENFKGSGKPDFYCTPHLVNVMLLARDMNGRRIYESKAELAKALNVGTIYEIEQFEDKTRTTDGGETKKLLGIFVNLADYQFGSTKGGEVAKFEDFDIDFNKYKYLMETRLSGALVKPYAAIALEEPVTAG
jgi:hypothetical protein